jgi:DNA-binding HxlR family transcriptional regulator
MSTSVLYQRLGELTESGLIEQNDIGHYQLTPIGTALRSAIAPLDTWAQTWAARGSADGNPQHPVAEVPS